MMKTTNPLVLLRHGEAAMPAGCCVGQLDVALTERGREQVHRLADRWTRPKPTVIHCSDLLRTRETAQILAQSLQCELRPDRRLREIDFGEWEGRSWDLIHQQDAELMARWGDDWLNTRPPQGENVVDLYQRVTQWAQDLEAHALVVAHAGSLRALQCYLQGLPPERLFDYAFEHATPVMVD